MEANQVVITIKEVIGGKYRDCLAGTFKFENDKCSLEKRGGVYGVAIDLSNATEVEKKSIFEKGNKKNKVSFDQWKTIGNGFYPLYWGKDSNLGSRLYEHAKNSFSVHSLQLNKRTELIGETVIYGAVLCDDISNSEKELQKKYPDIYQTIKDKK